MPKLSISNFRDTTLDISIEPIAHAYDIPAGATAQIVSRSMPEGDTIEMTWNADGGVGIFLPEDTEFFIEGVKIAPS